MKMSNFFLTTQKETPADAELVSHQLMLRAGMIRKLGSGLYTWMPLGLRVLHKVATIVRQAMDNAGALELLMPAVQPAELWQETDRWETFGNQLLKLHDRGKRSYCFGPTHEEVITDIMRHELNSYRQLPLITYQIQTKFRDEIRPRFGVMRAREFCMKDAYSFHIDQTSLSHSYQTMYAAYCKIFDTIGLDYRPVLADTGAIGGTQSHEFQVLAQSGEDIIAYSDSSDYAANIELGDLEKAKPGDPSPDGKGTLKFCRGIEVGHIFQLGDKYSRSMNATVLDEQGKAQYLQMGCYGLGVSRIVAASIEQHHDNNGIIWPTRIAPFQIAIVPIKLHSSEQLRTTVATLYQQLTAAGFEVLLDDRNERPGTMFADMDLIGIPHRLVMSEKGLNNSNVEYKNRSTGDIQSLPLATLVDSLNHIMGESA